MNPQHHQLSYRLLHKKKASDTNEKGMCFCACHGISCAAQADGVDDCLSVRSICGAHHRIFCKMVCFHMCSFDFAGDFPFSASEERIFTGMHGHVLRW